MRCPDDELLQHGRADATLAAHVQGCARCQARLVELSGLDATLDSQRTFQRAGPATDSVSEGMTVGAYVVSRRLGAGAMGAVYAAWDPRLEREVALKVLHLDLGDLVSEARLLARLAHPNVVTVYEVLPWNGRLVLVMELARGQTLREWLAAAPRPLAKVLDVFTQCAAGLAAAHAAGIVHRDFKPDNALVDEAGRARLLDFGLALHAAGPGPAGLAGSPAYLALQQLQGAPADARADQFAWWVSLYEALVGRRPHEGNTLGDLVEARQQRPVDLSALPAWLRPHVARGLSNDPAARFPSMEAAAKALVPPRRWGPIGAGALAVVAALVGGAVTLATPSPCSTLSAAPEALAARAKEPALGDAVREYATGVEACLALPKAAQPERAACLEQTGRELDLALEVLETDPTIAPELRPRVLRRVLPARRCAKDPRPLVTLPADAERPALLASHRAQLQFDALRAAGDPQAVLRFATQHREAAEAAKVPSALAWAHVNEAAALSGVGRIQQAAVQLRELEAVRNLGLRERTWAALGAWLFECYTSAEEQCETQEKRALRLVGELDEPWANAMRDEVSLRYLDDSPTVEETIEAWRAIPGAGYEARRALGNELAGLVTSDERLRVRRALELAKTLEPLEPRLRLVVAQLDLGAALREGDLARAQSRLRELETAPANDPNTQRAVFESKTLALTVRGRHREVLALVAATPAPEGDPRFRYRALLVRLVSLHHLREAGLAEVQQQLDLLLPTLGADERSFLETTRAQLALADGDAAALAQLDAHDGEDVLRRWQLAVLRGDRAAEAALLEQARGASPDDFVGRRIHLAGLIEAGRWADALEAARRLRAEVPSIQLELQVRLDEAWARWQLGDKDEACRVVNDAVLAASLVPRERERGETLRRECPRLGLTSWVEEPPAPRP